MYSFEYSRTVTHLMPSPYKTNCFDYHKIGCKSRQDCIDKCHIEMTVKKCNCLPSKMNFDRNNTCDHTYSGFQVNCTRNFVIICNEKYKSPDCINEYYSFGTTQDTNFNDRFSQEYLQLLIKSIN